MELMTISDQDFTHFQSFIYETAGIKLSTSKKAMVSGRLAKRLKEYGFKTYGEYFRLLMSGKQPTELQVAVDLLTTNETFFFREPKHFDFLETRVLPEFKSSRSIRIWSAASSTGEEAYTIAMVLSNALGEGTWEIFASDISTRVLEKARAAQYPIERAKDIPKNLLTAYCLKGVGAQEGTFIIDKKLRNHVTFQQVNLNTTLPKVGEFDVIFLRNVMIYFDVKTKREVVKRLTQTLKPGGYFIIGHSETLNDVCADLTPVIPTVYRKH